MYSFNADNFLDLLYTYNGYKSIFLYWKEFGGCDG
jgi:hypothetical protein